MITYTDISGEWLEWGLVAETLASPGSTTICSTRSCRQLLPVPNVRLSWTVALCSERTVN